jgi:hypothetical protein
VGLIAFRDADRTEWRVCEVTAAQLEAWREGREARARPGAAPGARTVLPGLERGWLCFESWAEKRRLVPPYPTGYRDLPPVELERLLRQAAVVDRPAGRSEIAVAGREPADAAIDPSAFADWPGVDGLRLVALRSAIQASLRDGLPDGETRYALQLFCAAVRERGIGLARVLRALGAVWASLPEANVPDRTDGEALRDWLLAAGIEAYHAAQPGHA